MKITSWLSAIVLGTLVALCSAGEAQAAPEFGLPDLTFAARGSGRTCSIQRVGFQDCGCPVSFTSSSFFMNVSTSLGDAAAIDYGSGFVPTSTTIIDEGIGGHAIPGGFSYVLNGTLQLGPGASLSFGGPLVLEHTLVGYDGFALMQVVAALPGGPFHVGETLGLDLHLFNVKWESAEGGYWCADVKGDLAPVVPEPASASLVLLGLGAVASAARRKRSA